MLKYLEMRVELLETLRSLADAEYQKKAWVNQDFPPGIEYDEFDYAVHFIYDQAGLAEDPEGTIGLFVQDQQELEMIKAVVDALERVFQAVGMKATDEEYISCPEWSDVLKTAQKAMHVMKNKPVTTQYESESGV